MTDETVLNISILKEHIEQANEDIEVFRAAIKALEQEPCEDAVNRKALISHIENQSREWGEDYDAQQILGDIEDMPSVTPQPKTGQYEKHIDHTDCIWYGNDSGCPVTCSQYRDGWNDAMDYIFKNGKGYQPYRHDG